MTDAPPQPPSPSVPLVLGDWDAAEAQRTTLTEAEVERWHKVRWGAALGVVPQVLLVALFGLLLAAGAGPSAWMLVVLNVYIVPVTLLAGVACLLWRAARPFGAALLVGTVVGAGVFTLVCFAIDRL